VLVIGVQYLLNIVSTAEHYLIRSYSPTTCSAKTSECSVWCLKNEEGKRMCFEYLLGILYISRCSSLSPTSHLSSLKTKNCLSTRPWVAFLGFSAPNMYRMNECCSPFSSLENYPLASLAREPNLAKLNICFSPFSSSENHSSYFFVRTESKHSKNQTMSSVAGHAHDRSCRSSWILRVYTDSVPSICSPHTTHYVSNLSRKIQHRLSMLFLLPLQNPKQQGHVLSCRFGHSKTHFNTRL
jgi:hypothetical protein